MRPRQTSDHIPRRSLPSANEHAFVLAAIFRKVKALLAPADEKKYTPIIFARDAILGIICGMLILSCGVFLDHHNILHFQSAHHFREMAYQLLSDPETITTLEEGADMKFVGREDYQSGWGEIDAIRTRLGEHEVTLKEKAEALDRERKELEALRQEYDKLINDPLIELSKYCGTCKWGGSFTCDQRVTFLEHTYNTNRILAMNNAMRRESCKKKG